MTEMEKKKANERNCTCVSTPSTRFWFGIIFSMPFPNRLRPCHASPVGNILFAFVDDVCARWTSNNANILIEKKNNKKLQQTKTREHVYFRVKLGSDADARASIWWCVCVDTVNTVISLLFDFSQRNNNDMAHQIQPSTAALVASPCANVSTWSWSMCVSSASLCLHFQRISHIFFRTRRQTLAIVCWK